MSACLVNDLTKMKRFDCILLSLSGIKSYLFNDIVTVACINGSLFVSVCYFYNYGEYFLLNIVLIEKAFDLS